MEKNYTVAFDFTTVKGNKLTGHKGEIDITSNAEPEELMKGSKLKKFIRADLERNPKVKEMIFDITITKIIDSNLAIDKTKEHG